MLSTSINARTQLQQAVNPHLIIIGALLELSNAELESMIREELERNPALDAEPTDPPPDQPPAVSPPSWEPNTLGRNISSRSRANAPSGADAFDPMSQVPATPTLRDYLRYQFRAAAPESLHAAGEYLIENVNTDGYLECNLSEAAQELEISLDDVQHALAILQELDPSGVGARDLRECLLLQFRYIDPHADVPESLEDVIQASTADGPSRLPEIARRAEMPVPQTQTCLEFIRANFAPYPGRSLRTSWGETVGEKQVQIIPDVIVQLDGDHVLVHVPESQSFRLRLNGAYRRLSQAMETERAYARYCHDGSRTRRRSSELTRAWEQATECVRRARSLIQQIQQRNRTIWQVTTAVVNHQKEFLLHGPDRLVPLTKKEIAQALGIHESIVCRATRGKHVMIPSGEVINFAVFFDDALPVRTLVHGLIAHENPAKPLSDADIARSLASSGIEIARRTVTKYRRVLRIPPARDRLQCSVAGGR